MRRPGLNLFATASMAVVLWASVPAESPVADAAQNGDVEAVRELLRSGADVNAAQGDGMTALHWAALNGNADIAEVLLYAGATTESKTRLGGYTPLHLASRSGNMDVAIKLLERGSDPNNMTSTGVTALHFAAEAGDAALISTLVGKGAEVDARDGFAERTPLIFASARNEVVAMQALLDAGADLSLTTSVKDYPARARADGQERSKRARIQRAANPPQRPTRRPAARRDTAQADTTRADTTRADTTAADTTAQTPDSTAGKPDSTASTPDSTATPPDSTAATPDSTAAARPDSTPADTATRRTRPTRAPRPLSYTDMVGKQGGMSAMHYAARDGHFEAVRLLVESGADVNQLTEGDSSTAMLVAIINGNFDIAHYLLQHGSDPNLASEDEVAPVFAVVNNYWALRTWYPQPNAGQQQEISYLDMMRALLEAGADPNHRVKTHVWYAAYNAGRMGVDFSGATAFWRAAYSLDVDAMRLLVEYGADPNISTLARPRRRFSSRSQPDTTEQVDPSGLPPYEYGQPAVHPLHAASGVGYGTSRVGQQHRTVPDGWLPAVTYLVDELGVEVNVRDHDGYSAVHNAAARGDNPTIQFLIDRGADVTFVSRRGQTTVDMANGPQQRVQPFPETIALLEAHGALNNNNCISCD